MPGLWGMKRSRALSRSVLLPALVLVAAEVSAQGAPAGRALLEPTDRAMLSAEIGARIDEMPFQPGEQFAKGDLLVALDCSLFSAQRARVEAEAEAARLEAENAEELNSMRSIGRLEVALAEQAYAQARAELRVARLNEARCTIRAPFAGEVAEWQVRPHEFAKPQEPVLEIVASQSLEAEIVAPAVWIGNVAVGDALDIRLDGGNQMIAAEITRINPVIDPVSETVTYYARPVMYPWMAIGMTGTATPSLKE